MHPFGACSSLPVTVSGVDRLETLASHFAGDVQEDAFGEAFDYLCESQRSLQTLAEFTTTNGGDFAVFREFRGSIFGTVAEHKYVELDRFDSSWSEYDIAGPETTQTWRLHLVREGRWLLYSGDWNVCAIEYRDERLTEYCWDEFGHLRHYGSCDD